MATVRASAWIAPLVRRLVVEAPRVATELRPGQYVVLRVTPDGERLPLPVAESDREAGTITLVVSVTGAATERLGAVGVGEALASVTGPLGRPTELGRFGHVVLVGGGPGAATLHPHSVALRALGNRVTALLGAPSAAHLVYEEELARHCDVVLACTDDGSRGFAGYVTSRLARLLADEPVDVVFAAGSVPLMKAVAAVTRPLGLSTVASLSPLLVDGTGMCGGCRVTVRGEPRFACVDGPEFDAHDVAFEELWDRVGDPRRRDPLGRERPADGGDHRCHLGRERTAATEALLYPAPRVG